MPKNELWRIENLEVNEHENLQFDNEEYIHMSSKNYESGYSLDLDLLTTFS